MIGVDTNILVRYLSHDDPAQARAAGALIAEHLESGARLHIDDIVLCEMVWVARSLSLRQSNDRVDRGFDLLS